MGKIYQLVKEIRIVRMMLFSLILNYRVAEIFNVMILLIGFIIYYSVYDSLLLWTIILAFQLLDFYYEYSSQKDRK